MPDTRGASLQNLKAAGSQTYGRTPSQARATFADSPARYVPLPRKRTFRFLGRMLAASDLGIALADSLMHRVASNPYEHRHALASEGHAREYSAGNEKSPTVSRRA
jgi:hypothetical protein